MMVVLVLVLSVIESMPVKCKCQTRTSWEFFTMVFVGRRDGNPPGRAAMHTTGIISVK